MNSLSLLLTADFVIFALAAGIALALITGPLGSFVVWKKMSYFGDTLAHASLLGISLALVFEVNIQISILMVCLCAAFVLTGLNKSSSISADTILGIIAHSSLALGIVMLRFSSAPRIDLEAYLFGALLTVSGSDLIWIIGVSIIVAGTLFYFWEELLTTTVDLDLAKTDGISTEKFQLLLSLLIALTVAISIKIVGVLLITSLLIIPPAASRNFSSTPEMMALLSSIVGVMSVIVGVLSSFLFNTPVGPSIVVAATMLYCLALVTTKKLRRN